MRDRWIERALDVPRAFGSPLGTGRLRVEPEDFLVDEDLGFAPSGAGAHVLVRVRKRGANTEWVAREIARHAGCRPADVGFAGLKDRHAVTTQWFSVPSPRGAAYVGDTIALLSGAKGEGYEVLEAHAHAKKLPRGALAGNRFAIRVRDVTAVPGTGLRDVTAVPGADARDATSPDAAIAARVAAIARDGLPNFFGPQRFGRDGANLRKISPDLSAVHPRERTYVLSAARSLVFNAVLAERVKDGTWCRLESGDVANLDGKGSVFPVDAVDDALTGRIAALDVHPTGPMWGKGELLSQGRVRDLEQRVGGELAEPCELVIAAGMNQERRALRLAVRELSWERQGANVVLRFWLTKGSFATTVLGELFETAAIEEEAS
jgi:tRNA pseudouridine13 synthase